MEKKLTVGVALFDEFEVLDVYGPVEMYGMLPDNFKIFMVSEDGGEVASKQGPRTVADHDFNEDLQYDILLVPGGKGTRDGVDNLALLEWIRKQAEGAQFVTSVCTGSALLARSGIIDGLRATTNKRSFAWATSQSDEVIWQKRARWVEDGKFFTSSGVSAGMDMTLALIARIFDVRTAEQIAIQAEYEWHKSSDWDPFSEINGLVNSR